MQIDEINDVFDFLKERYTPEGVLLFGSYARGMSNPTSDIDLCCICRGTDSLKKQNLYFDGKYLDVTLIPLLDDYKVFPELLEKIEDAKIIFDTTGHCAAISQQANEYRASKEWVMTTNEKKDLIASTLKSLHRCQRNEEFVTDVRKINLVNGLIKTYFYLREILPPDIRRSWIYLRKDDKKIADLFEKVFKTNLDYTSIEKLTVAILDSPKK